MVKIINNIGFNDESFSVMPGAYNTTITTLFLLLRVSRIAKSPTKLFSECFHFHLNCTAMCSLLSKLKRKSLAALESEKKRIFAYNSCACLSLRKNFFRYKIHCRHSSNIQFRFHFQRETLAWITSEQYNEGTIVD